LALLSQLLDRTRKKTVSDTPQIRSDRCIAGKIEAGEFGKLAAIKAKSEARMWRIFDIDQADPAQAKSKI
jgi:hypothetical protein